MLWPTSTYFISSSAAGEAINSTKYKPPYYWEANMGTVPKDSCVRCQCNGTCSGAAFATGLTIEMLLKPHPECFSSSFTFFGTFPPLANRTSLARVTGSTLLFTSQTTEVPTAAAREDSYEGTSPSIEAELKGTGVLSADYLFDGNWHHFAFVKDAATGDQAIWVDGQSPPAFRTTGSSKGVRMWRANKTRARGCNEHGWAGVGRRARVYRYLPR